MSPREHATLRLCGLLLLLVAGAWPSSHGANQRHAVAVSASLHQAMTTGARGIGDDGPRPRAVRAIDEAVDRSLADVALEPSTN